MNFDSFSNAGCDGVLKTVAPDNKNNHVLITGVIKIFSNSKIFKYPLSC